MRKNMKIAINENETYEIKIPNEVDTKSFMELLTSFDNIVKLIKFNIIKEDGVLKVKKHYTKRADGLKSNTRIWCNTREKTLDLMQYCYHGTLEDRKRIQGIANCEWNEIVKGFHGLKTRFNIKPQDVGLNFWRGKGVSIYSLSNWKIKDWIIKSYTGYFDEK